MFMMGFVKERGKGVGQRESATKAHAPRQLVQKISQIITQLAPAQMSPALLCQQGLTAQHPYFCIILHQSKGLLWI
jgi:hypothetical protein